MNPKFIKGSPKAAANPFEFIKVAIAALVVTATILSAAKLTSIILSVFG